MSNHPFRPLRHSAVRLIWGAGVLSDVGTWVQLVVVGSLVARNSGSALLTGLIALATITPQGLCAPIGGLFADRYDRRKVFVAGLLGQGIVTSLLTVLLAVGVREPVVLSLVILCSSAAGALGAPAYSAMLPDLVPPDELMAMVSMGIYSWNSGRIVGPLLAAGLSGAVGPAWTVGFNAATFLVMAFSVSRLDRAFHPPGADHAAGVRDRLAEGWAALRINRGCQASIALVSLLNVSVAGFVGLIPIFVAAVFDGGTRLIGLFSALQGAGAIIGSLSAALLTERIGRSRVLLGLLPMLTVAYLGYALAPAPWVAAVAVVVLGAGSSSVFVAAMTVAQRDAPDAQRGRVLALVQGSMGLCYGIGVVWIGLIGDVVGMRTGFVCGAIALVSISLLLTRRTPDWRRVIDGTDSSRLVPVHLGDPPPSIDAV